MEEVKETANTGSFFNQLSNKLEETNNDNHEVATKNAISQQQNEQQNNSDDDESKSQLISAAKYKAKLLLARANKKKKKSHKGSKLFEVKFWNSVAVSSWQCDCGGCCSACSICKNSCLEVCVECSSRHPADVADCKVGWGICNHMFHVHCILRWLKHHPVCPLCNHPWEFQAHN
ncbi:hypothetical protein FDP41_004427 [Naegleria fowleri]|uniref:RING-type domain-containing protein n=1 Tax=Naegleria fowleri TaxID=5763 RepID=A0A6A5BQM4_NAEFO|nr:uncharacterized protein FDP41_004427 [Naegleria fowleri]KAF0976528.1 hypothetical protein FDP41_004427 [Naegleria fowleri]